jgi:pimeloyl-ACP methyl ester carboxylesterase
MKLAFDRGGDGDRLLVLLHGLGADRHVWQAMLSGNRWDGSWIAPDLRGHGASAHADSYALEAHAGDVAETIGAGRREITVLGHSMGGAVALALASGAYGVLPRRVFGLGIKVAWNDDELAGLERMASAPVKYFATREEAAARYLKVAGLAASDHPAIVEGESGWRLAADPAAARIGPPSMTELIAATRAPFHLARGAADRMVSLEQLCAYDSEAVDIPDAGHNAMIDQPGEVWDWVL